MGASGGSISANVKQGFQWHPAARLFDGAGREWFARSAGGGVVAERPSGAAIVAALGGGAFRIGGAGEAPGEGFETLTSGSSGAPRRIARGVASWTASFAVNAGLFGIGPGVRVAVLGRLTQSLALYGALEGMHLGAEVHLLDDLRPDRQAERLAGGVGADGAPPPLLQHEGGGGASSADEAPAAGRLGSPSPSWGGVGFGGTRGIEVLYATPAQMRLCCEAGVPWPGLRHLVIGGSKLDAGLGARVRALAPSARISEFYGAAEASFISLAGPDCPEDSVGRAYPGVEIALEGGEIWVRSPYLFQGYAGADPGGARWRDGWLSVGERGEMRDGFLYLQGRAGRMVTVADQNVFPEEIETFLMGLEGVRQAAVVPEADGLRGLRLVAVLQGDADEEAILRALRGRLGPLKAPKRVVWVEDWPVLPSGKTDFRAIEARVTG